MLPRAQKNSLLPRVRLAGIFGSVSRSQRSNLYLGSVVLPRYCGCSKRDPQLQRSFGSPMANGNTSGRSLILSFQESYT
jgi:hypothetical protein